MQNRFVRLSTAHQRWEIGTGMSNVYRRVANLNMLAQQGLPQKRECVIPVRIRAKNTGIFPRTVLMLKVELVAGSKSRIATQHPPLLPSSDLTKSLVRDERMQCPKAALKQRTRGYKMTSTTKPTDC